MSKDITLTTYAELLADLLKLTKDQLDCTVTVQDGLDDEFYPAELRISGEDNGILDEDHPVIWMCQ